MPLVKPNLTHIEKNNIAGKINETEKHKEAHEKKLAVLKVKTKQTVH